MELRHRMISGILLAMLLVGTLMMIIQVSSAKTTAAIYISAEGAVVGTTLIQTADNVTYVFTADINGRIIVQRNSIVIEGNGHTLQGVGSVDPLESGIELSGRTNVTVRNTRVNGFAWGIRLSSSLDNIISGNTVRDEIYVGIALWSSSRNRVFGNTLTNDNYGVDLSDSTSNVVYGNTITANGNAGILLHASSNNTVSGNTLTSNVNSIWVSYYSDHNKILENRLEDNTWGILIYIASDYNEISGNNIKGSTDGITFNTLSEPNRHNIVSRNNLTNNSAGINLYYSLNNSILDNDASNNLMGIGLWSCSNSTLSGNNVTANAYCGVTLGVSSNVIIFGNDIKNNGYSDVPQWSGLELYNASDTIIFHNNFISNSAQVHSDGSTEAWNDGYPSGGNYWSDYNGADLQGGPYQNITGSDGIGDEPYTIYANTTDAYPFMGPFTDFDVGMWNGTQHNVGVVSNSTLANFAFDITTNPPALSFNVTGTIDTSSFSRVAIPKAFMWSDNDYEWNVTADGMPLQRSVSTDADYTYIYFTYNFSAQTIQITGTYAVFFSTISPTSLTIDIGQSGNFTLAILGGISPYSYQWYLNGSPVSGANSNIWTFIPILTGTHQIHIVIIDNKGRSATSNTATVSVNPALSVSLSPDVTLDLGQSHLFAPSISGGTPPYFYQWYLNDALLTGETSTVWNFTPSSAGSYAVYVKVYDSVGALESSETANVTVNLVPAATIAPATAVLDVGQLHQFQSTVSGGASPFTYQWYLNDVAVSDGKDPTWIFTPNASGSYDVYLNVMDNVSVIAKSNIAIVTVNSAPSVTISPSSVTLDAGQSQSFMSTVSGGTLSYTYQWYLDNVAVSGATDSSWTFEPSSSTSHTVYVKITDAVGVIATSNIAEVAVNAELPSPTIPLIVAATVLTIILAVCVALIRRRKKDKVRS